jgi:hypothetical protein
VRSGTAPSQPDLQVWCCRARLDLDAREAIVNTKLISGVGATAGSVVGGMAGAQVGMMTGYFASLVGLVLGIYLARRFVHAYLE